MIRIPNNLQGFEDDDQNTYEMYCFYVCYLFMYICTSRFLDVFVSEVTVYPIQ